MIKINVILNNITWKKYLKNPHSFIDKKIGLLNKKNKLYKKKTLICSLLLSGTEEIKKLNKKFRKKNKSTDVLSFPFYEKKQLNNRIKREKEIYLGDIIINLNKIKNKNNKVKFQDHFFLKKKFTVIEETLLSATMISEITKIPRATCIRKLTTLVNFKIIKKDNFTKKYSLNIKTFFNALDTKEITKETFNLSGNFYLIIIKALIRSQNRAKLKS